MTVITTNTSGSYYPAGDPINIPANGNWITYPGTTYPPATIIYQYCHHCHNGDLATTLLLERIKELESRLAALEAASDV